MYLVSLVKFYNQYKLSSSLAFTFQILNSTNLIETILRSLHTFFSKVAYCQVFENAWPKQSAIKILF
jgi:hypothetical protein